MIRRVQSLWQAVRQDQSGAVLVEFAFVAPVLCLMIMGGFDAGYTIYLRSVASGALEARARAASLEGATESQFDSEIRATMRNIMPSYAQEDENIVLSKRNYTDYSRIDSAEEITTDNNNNGVLDVGDCWLDEDENGEFGTNEGASGLGGADDGVYYTITLSFPRLFPLASMIGLPEDQELTVQTLVINQPYGQQTIRPTECRTS